MTPTIPPQTVAALNADPVLRLAVMEIAFASSQQSSHPELPAPAPWFRDVPILDDPADQILATLRDVGLVETGGRHKSQGLRETLHLTEAAALWLHAVGFGYHAAQLIRETRTALFGEDWPDRAEAVGIVNGFSFSFLHGVAAEGVAS